MSALELSDVHAQYPSRGTPRPALDGVTLGVEAGQVVALIGPNGAGKSTLLRVASGVLRPSAGRVRLQGQDLAHLSPRQVARRVAVVAQDTALPAGLTARELVALGRTPHVRLLLGHGPADRAAMERALDVTGALALADRFVDELSGGERQRVVLARALAQEPAVLLLDEPTANLDLRHQVAVLDLIRGLARERGLAVLAALHDLQLAALYADRVAMLWEGRLVAQGSPEEVLTAPLLARVFQQPVALVPHPTQGVPLAVLEPGGGAGRARVQPAAVVRPDPRALLAPPAPKGARG